MRARESEVIFSLSPIAGIGLTMTSGDAGSFGTGIQASAITPALLFAFVFNSLLVSARRMTHRAFVAAADSAKDGFRAMGAEPDSPAP